MIEFYFNHQIDLEELSKDENLDVQMSPDFDRIFISLASITDEKNPRSWPIWMYSNRSNFAEGHSTAVVDYLYQKYGYLFVDGPEEIYHYEDILNTEKMGLTNGEYQILFDGICLEQMAAEYPKYFSDDEEVIQRVKKQYEDFLPEFNRVRKETGLDLILELNDLREKRHKRQEELEEERRKKFEVGRDLENLPF